MTTEQQVQSSDIYRANGDTDAHTNKMNDGTSSTASSELYLHHSRFFRTKRKQRLGENTTNINGICIVSVFHI